MKLGSRIWIGLKALRQLGLSQLALYGLYQFGLRSGHYQRQLSASLTKVNTLDYKNIKLHPCLNSLPEPGLLQKVLNDQVETLYAQADEIVDGKIRLFGGPPVPLELCLDGPLENWSRYEFMDGRVGGKDIKFTWEPGRFGWACTLAMAYHISKKDAYAHAFWQYTNQFLEANPAYMGPHWCSAQEAAIRLVCLAFACQVFAQNGHANETQLETLGRAIAIHAERIPPTLVYARSQNNNHLIMEGLGLYTASAILPGHPFANRWRILGRQWLEHAFHTQLEPDGTYTQHSANYHRLMLQAALWAKGISAHTEQALPYSVNDFARLCSAAEWLAKMTDPNTGRVPNYGHNDGAYILPLSVCPYDDYRPVVHAALQAFTPKNLPPDGPWKDMGLWLGFADQPARTALEASTSESAQLDIPGLPPHVISNQANGAYAVIHVSQYHSRPAHADQLHLDLWWRGLNLAIDPGTYLYNAPSPWENSLTSAFVHNTVTVDGREFMQRAGRFLYLDWAQAKVLASRADPTSKSYTFIAEHDGYRGLGITHTRIVTSFEDGHWEIVDRLSGPPNRDHSFRLHWLLPDWEYIVRQTRFQAKPPTAEVRLRSPFGWVAVNMTKTYLSSEKLLTLAFNLQVARAGVLVYGSGKVSPNSGWISPTYAQKIPALACILSVTQSLPIELKSTWILPNDR